MQKGIVDTMAPISLVKHPSNKASISIKPKRKTPIVASHFLYDVISKENRSNI